MNATKKSYKIDNNDFVEGINLELPGLEWVDANGNTFRAIGLDMNCDLRGNIIKFVVLTQIKAVGRDVWNRESIFEIKVDKSEYRNLTTGAICEPVYIDGILDSNIVTNFEFFIKLFGHNVDNVPASIFSYLIETIATKFSLTIVE